MGKYFCEHPYFPNKTNVHFANIKTNKDIDLISWERGDGITLGCGTGSCAAVVAGYLTEKVDNQVTVHNPGGDLQIEYQKEGNRLTMAGPAETIAIGRYMF